MANRKRTSGKGSLLSSTALTKQLATFGALGLAFGATSAHALDANALPTDPNVVGGKATFKQSGATLNVKQSTDRTVIDWRSFDIGSKATTNFSQPGSSSIAVNRVNGSTNPTQIQGSLNANGQVWILNPNGVFFGKNAKIDVAGILASTGNIDTKAFMRGDNRLLFTGGDGGSVENAGSITVADGGLAAFVAPSVRNSGVIRARLGKVTLASGTTYTLDLAGDQLVELGIGAKNAVVDQSGQILADGSVVTLTAKAATEVVDSVVNVSGTVMASGIEEKGGKIILTADNVATGADATLTADGGTNGDGGSIYAYADKTGNYAGSFSAKGGSASGDGGSIETSGKKVDIQSGLKVDATAANGATGTWTIDPDDLTIDSGNVGTYETALDSANVNILADNSITLSTDFDTSSQSNSNTLNFQDEGADNSLTINLNGKITLASTQSLTGEGTTVNVGSASSIQNGVDVSAAGATVNVSAGTYDSFGTSFGGAANLTIQTTEGAVIDASTRPSNNRVVDLRADGTTFSGFTINNGSGGGVGVSISGQGVTVSGNNISDVLTGVQTTTQYTAGNAIISGNTIDTQYGISLQNTGNTVSGNTVTASAEGVGLLQGSNTFTNNIFNTGSGANAFVLYGSASANDLTSSGNTVNIEGGALQGAVYLAGTNGAINLAVGTYSLASTLYLKNDGLTVTGADEATTIINSSSAGYGIAVQGDDVTLSTFTYNNTNPSGSYSFKVSPLGAATELDNFAIDHVTINDSHRTGLDLNGVNGATIDNVTVDNTDYGNGITLTDSANVTITNSTTTNNAWGGLALYQSNVYYDLQVDNISVDGTNSFENGIYAQDQSGTYDFGAIDLTGQGIQYVASISTGGSDGDYWFFQSTKQGAFDLADAFNTRYSQTGATVQGYTEADKSVDGNNIFYVGHATNTNVLSISAAIDAAASDATVNIDAGTYDETLSIDKNIDIEGAGVGQTILQPTSLLSTGVTHKYTSDMQATVFVNGASDVTISGLTIDGNGLDNDALIFWNNSSGTISNALLENVRTFSGAQTGQGIAVDGSGGTVDLTVSNVTIQNYNKNAIDVINGNGGTTGGSDVTLNVADSTFIGRGTTGTIAQNGVVLWERAGGTIDATIDGTAFSELGYDDPNTATAAGVLVYGSPNGTTSVSNSTFTNVQDYIDLAGGATNDIDATTGNTFDGVAQSSATLSDFYSIMAHINDGLTESGNGLVRLVANSLFLTEANGDIANAVSVADSGDTLNIQSGSFTLSGELAVDKGLTIAGAGSGSTDITSSSTGYGIAVTGDDVTLSGFTFNANSGGTYAIKVYPDTSVSTDRLLNFAIDDVVVDGSKKTGLDLNGVNGATINNVTIKNTTNGNGIALTDSSNVTITNTTTTNNAWGGLALYQSNRYYDGQVTNISVDGTNTFNESNPVYLEDESDGSTAYGGVNGIDFGTLDIQGFSYAAHNTDASDFYSWLQTSVEGAGDQMQAKGVISTGYVTGWTGSASNNTFYVGHATDDTAMSIAAAQANSSTDDTINVGSGTFAEAVTVSDARNFVFDGSTINSYTQNVASAIGGTVTAAGGFVLNALTYLISDTTLNGAVTAKSIDGTASGNRSLTINGGAIALNGSSYKGSALTFSGTGVTLSQATTTFNTSSVGGDITFNAPIFGTTNAAQSIVLNAGPGTGGSLNGDILMHNVGLESLKLGSMTATGHDLTADTVYLATNYSSTLTGNQTFSTETLHVGGNATSDVGGNATGPIVSGGTVDVSAGGNFSGNVTAPTTTVSAQNISGTFTGATTTLNATNSVDVTTNVTNLNVNSPSGTVDGDFTNYNSTGNSSIVVNGKTRAGSNETNPNQIIVEGFTLPSGSIVTSTGEIVLPSGMLVGLVSPAAGPGAEGSKPKVIIVHTVMKLGELLSQGYVAIIVDLNKGGDDEEVVAMN